MWRKPETRASWEPGEGSDEVLKVWEGARQHLAFVAYHETEAGTIFIDRLHAFEGARRRGVATSLLRKVVGSRQSELQVRIGNTNARRLYEKEGYVRVQEGGNGEYETQKGYYSMRKQGGRAEQGECGEEVRLLECGTSAQVPREVWM